MADSNHEFTDEELFGDIPGYSDYLKESQEFRKSVKGTFVGDLIAAAEAEALEEIKKSDASKTLADEEKKVVPTAQERGRATVSNVPSMEMDMDLKKEIETTVKTMNVAKINELLSNLKDPKELVLFVTTVEEIRDRKRSKPLTGSQIQKLNGFITHVKMLDMYPKEKTKKEIWKSKIEGVTKKKLKKIERIDKAKESSWEDEFGKYNRRDAIRFFKQDGINDEWNPTYLAAVSEYLGKKDSSVDWEVIDKAEELFEKMGFIHASDTREQQADQRDKNLKDHMYNQWIKFITSRRIPLNTIENLVNKTEVLSSEEFTVLKEYRNLIKDWLKRKIETTELMNYADYELSAQEEQEVVILEQQLANKQISPAVYEQKIQEIYKESLSDLQIPFNGKKMGVEDLLKIIGTKLKSYDTKSPIQSTADRIAEERNKLGGGEVTPSTNYAASTPLAKDKIAQTISEVTGKQGRFGADIPLQEAQAMVNIGMTTEDYKRLFDLETKRRHRQGSIKDNLDPHEIQEYIDILWKYKDNWDQIVIYYRYPTTDDVVPTGVTPDIIFANLIKAGGRKPRETEPEDSAEEETAPEDVGGASPVDTEPTVEEDDGLDDLFNSVTDLISEILDDNISEKNRSSILRLLDLLENDISQETLLYVLNRLEFLIKEGL
jgi:hypothetical protein